MLIDSNTWVQCGPSPSRSSFFSSCFYLLVKTDEERIPKRLKALRVDYRNFQAHPNNYAELYAPVVYIDLVRTFMSVAVSQDCI